MVTLAELELQLSAKQIQLEGVQAALERERQRVSTAKRFSPGLLDQNARRQKPILQSQIQALQNKIDEMKANTQEKPTISQESNTQQKQGINPLILLGGLGLILLL